MKKILLIALVGVAGLAFATTLRFPVGQEPVSIPASPQRGGDASEGYRYLVTGDYIKSGIPYDYFLLGFGKTAANLLHRDSLNAQVSHEYTAVKAANGEVIVAPNCLQCHAQVFDGKLYVGLGNSTIDFTDRKKLNSRGAFVAEKMLAKGDQRKYEAAEPFI